MHGGSLLCNDTNLHWLDMSDSIQFRTTILHSMSPEYFSELLGRLPSRPSKDVPYSTKSADAWPVRSQTYGYLPSFGAWPPLHLYHIILLGDRGRCVWATCTLQCDGWELNMWPPRHESRHSFTRLPSHVYDIIVL